VWYGNNEDPELIGDLCYACWEKLAKKLRVLTRA
jgi:hypothetical protein